MSPPAPSLRPAGRGQPSNAAVTGGKRSAAESVEPEEEALIVEAAQPSQAALPTRHTSRRTAGSRMAAILAEEAADEEAVAPSRALPQREAAMRSPTGKRRRLTSQLALQQLAAAAEQVEAETAAVASGLEVEPTEAAAVPTGW